MPITRQPLEGYGCTQDRPGTPSSICRERMFVVARGHAILCLLVRMEERMRELQSEVTADRRVAPIEHAYGRYTVTIAVRGPQRDWEDISLYAGTAVQRTSSAAAATT